ncbi:MAG: flagellar filament capping protein FliD [Candidatus Caldatribacterium sp.]|uniref:flagellar filament capping protein FliD n=1 Tax=Candidatus Caldatribacterium sp. TaxID=2282143 RepID=UPI0029987A23|nr:flagellar filament capping protein FliD [Candidatus Caldatribacterium sp.]MCX7729697.1 flagellar filament capping protein FliD [Candidatus Caldatribacterium sp.]MDW8082130.1 flagellar filament capping protein FliD [Candidatus Calescibacterium sp.]
MAGTLTIDGLISGLKTSEIIEKLVEVERAPIKRLEAKKTTYTERLTLLKTAATKLLNLKASALNLSLSSTFLAKKATVLGDALSVSIGGGAQEGTYILQVESLAKAHQIATSSAYTSTDVRFGEGRITVTVNGRTTEIAIGTTNNTLSGIRDAINRAGAGVRASIVKTQEGYRLLLASERTGVENAIGVTVELTGGEATIEGWTEIQAAQNARILLGETNPVVYEGPTNVVVDFLPGMTLNLKDTGRVTVTVFRDFDAVKRSIVDFTNALRDFLQFVKDNASYSAETKVAGALLGETTLLRVTAELMKRLTSRVAPSGLQSVMDLGISIDRYGNLTVDEGKLTQVLETNLEGVQELFAGSRGVAKSLNEYLAFVTNPYEGMVTSAQKLYDKVIKDLDERIALMEERLEAQKVRWQKQFAALESYLGTMQTQSNWLAQQITNLSNLMRKS